MRKSRNVWLLVVLVCGLFVVSGCAGDKNAAAIQGVTSKQAAEMNASRADFESAEEPALTEKFRLLLIGEGFNIFNVANLTGYSGTLDRVTRPAVAGGTATNPSFNFGQPTGRVNPVFGTGGPRALQFAARLAF